MNDRRSFTVTIEKYLPIFYAGASGDFNLIHIDREIGKKVGLGGNILHGLCTMGIAANQLLGNSDPQKLRSIKVRFSFPVCPEDELIIQSKYDGNKESFKVVKSNRQEVITNGVAQYR